VRWPGQRQPHGHAFRQCEDDLFALLFRMSAIEILLSTVRSDQNLFDLIPAGGGFLTVAKSHPVFSQYWETNYSHDREFCYEFFLSSRFSLSPPLLTKR
jgi:hypothetical protein